MASELGIISLNEIRDFASKHYVLAGCLVGLGIGYWWLRKFRSGGVCRCTTRMDGKTVLITGANTGIGKQTAINMAGRGARVIIACRDLLKAERAAEQIRKATGNGNVFAQQVDLASLKSVRSFVDKISQSEERLDVLVNNAGVMMCPYWKTEDGFEMQLGTNHLGHFLLTVLLLDQLKKSAPSRIITVSSLAHEKGKIHWNDLNSESDYNPLNAYQQSKLANVLFSKELSRRLEGTGVNTYVLNPGIVLTELQRHINAPLWKRIPLQLLFYAISKTPAEGAQTTIHCAVAPDLSNETGNYYSDCKEKKPAPQALDALAAQRLWNISLQMVGLPSED